MSPGQQFPFDIAIVGLGITGVHQVTREAEETIRRCNVTLLADSGLGVGEYVRTLCLEVTDFADRLESGGHRVDFYRGIASEVVAAALEAAPVCFATYGHPKMYSYPTVLVQRAAAILDLRVSILPGISFLDALLADLGLDPGFDGLQLYEATDLLVRRRPLQTDVGCVIAQAPVTAEAGTREAVHNLPNIALLRDHLLQFYPSDHEVVFVVSSPHPLLRPLRRTAPLSDLPAAVASGPQSGTLYIPPVERRPIADEPLAERMRRAAD